MVVPARAGSKEKRSELPVAKKCCSWVYSVVKVRMVWDLGSVLQRPVGILV